MNPLILIALGVMLIAGVPLWGVGLTVLLCGLFLLVVS